MRCHRSDLEHDKEPPPVDGIADDTGWECELRPKDALALVLDIELYRKVFK